MKVSSTPWLLPDDNPAAFGEIHDVQEIGLFFRENLDLAVVIRQHVSGHIALGVSPLGNFLVSIAKQIAPPHVREINLALAITVLIRQAHPNEMVEFVTSKCGKGLQAIRLTLQDGQFVKGDRDQFLRPSPSTSPTSIPTIPALKVWLLHKPGWRMAPSGVTSKKLGLR